MLLVWESRAFFSRASCCFVPASARLTQLLRFSAYYLSPQTMMASNEYLAKPSGACCLEGTLHSGEPRGTFTQIADVETYVATPPPGKSNGNIVLYFPDVWGMFPNGLLVMDGFANAGYLTLGIDYFRGVCYH